MSFAKHGLQVFDIPISVLPADIDDNDHVNNVV
jgi:acyl-CoA thioester hydrolase